LAFVDLLWASAMTSCAMSPKVGRGLAALLAASLSWIWVDPLVDQGAVCRCPAAGLLEADLGVRAQALVPSDATDLVAKHPLLTAVLSNNEVKTIAVAVTARPRCLDSAFS
jgi:hypothetical protein